MPYLNRSLVYIFMLATKKIFLFVRSLSVYYVFIYITSLISAIIYTDNFPTTDNKLLLWICSLIPASGITEPILIYKLLQLSNGRHIQDSVLFYLCILYSLRGLFAISNYGIQLVFLYKLRRNIISQTYKYTRHTKSMITVYWYNIKWMAIGALFILNIAFAATISSELYEDGKELCGVNHHGYAVSVLFAPAFFGIIYPVITTDTLYSVCSWAPRIPVYWCYMWVVVYGLLLIGFGVHTWYRCCERDKFDRGSSNDLASMYKESPEQEPV